MRCIVQNKKKMGEICFWVLYFQLKLVIILVLRIDEINPSTIKNVIFFPPLCGFITYKISREGSESHIFKSWSTTFINLEVYE